MKPLSGKRRTREHIIADLSICFVEWQALTCGYVVERMRHDYGIDLELKTFNRLGEAEPGDVLIQVKATDGLSVREGQTSVSWPIERAHLVRWLQELLPVVVIVFDAKKTRAFWVCIQEYFDALPAFNIFAAGNTITLHVPLANRVSPRAMRTFARLRDQYRKRNRSVDNE